jgi:antitoxin PrlF
MYAVALPARIRVRDGCSWMADRLADQLHIAGFLTKIYIVRNTELTMSTDATLTSKGQTTIPKPIRDSLAMKTGDRLTFTLMPDGVVLMRVKNKRVADVAGLLHRKGRKAVPVERLSR